MNLAYRSLGISALTFLIVNCSKGKTPAAADAAAATSANSSSVSMLGAYDLSTVSQIQFETSDTNSFRGPPGQHDIISKILILVMNNGAVQNSGVYLKAANGASCSSSVINFSSNDLVTALGNARLGPNSHAAIAPDAGYDRLSVFFKDGTSKVIPFDEMGAPVNQNVILETADEPLNDLLSAVYASGNCQPN